MPSGEPKTYVVTGASGLVGGALVRLLETDGHRVIRAVRRSVEDSDRELFWDPVAGKIEAEKLEGADAVVHLAGENISAHRWTAAFKQRIRDSRVLGTRLVADAIAGLENKPRVLACASAIGCYGNRGDEVLDEQSPPGDDFLADVCREWEDAAQPARDAGVRVATMRIGVVLSRDGGALAKMLTPFKLGAGGVIGSGEQYMSWIDLGDLARAIRFVADSDNLSGPVNLVAPGAVTNRQFTKTLGGVLRRPTIAPMPAIAARLLFGEMADALLLSSTRVVPNRLEEAGFRFEHPSLESSLQSQLARQK